MKESISPSNGWHQDLQIYRNSKEGSLDVLNGFDTKNQSREKKGDLQRFGIAQFEEKLHDCKCYYKE